LRLNGGVDFSGYSTCRRTLLLRMAAPQPLGNTTVEAFVSFRSCGSVANGTVEDQVDTTASDCTTLPLWPVLSGLAFLADCTDALP
jgi:hypothetical protein